MICMGYSINPIIIVITMNIVGHVRDRKPEVTSACICNIPYKFPRGEYLTFFEYKMARFIPT